MGGCSEYEQQDKPGLCYHMDSIFHLTGPDEKELPQRGQFRLLFVEVWL
jgi:hypothetical protein